MHDGFITLNELSNKLKISRSTIDRWRKEGMPFVKIGTGVRFVEDEVLDWIYKNKKG